ncbi:malto-oligosyltrehalose synthase [soil metagenome]
MTTIPRATARLQLHREFTLDDALTQVPYLHALGISHLYLSPIAASVPGSTHGYDGIDPARVDPELGGEAALQRLVAAVHRRGMGIVLDIVPNHLSSSVDHNRWWRAVLEHGRASAYADWFDIDWDNQEPGLHGRILLPLLGKQYGEALDDGELTVALCDDGEALELHYFDHTVPLSQATVLTHALEHDPDAKAPADAARAMLARCEGPHGREALHRLLEAQHYRLAWWRTAADEINWRRFFEVSDLIGLRIERPEVFEAAHALAFRLYAEGSIDAIRVDHVDGLADPAGYCRRLRERLVELHAQRPAERRAGQPWIIVEKILGIDETLRADWQVDGTTGYDFMNDALVLLHDAAGVERLRTAWPELTGDTLSYTRHVTNARRQLLGDNLNTEFETVVRWLHLLALADLRTRDLTHVRLRRIAGALLEQFRVYRIYTTIDEAGNRAPADQAVMEKALAAARASLPGDDDAVLALIDDWLGGRAIDPATPQHLRDLRVRVLARFEQLSSPLAAKSVEDTTFYRYAPLLSLNEVGGDPDRPSMDAEAFHRRTLDDSGRHPHRMLATATHDHKRGEDTRARLAVMSQCPEAWLALVEQLRAAGPVPIARNDELMIYQTLVGAWPQDLSARDADGVAGLLERVRQWLVKSVREAKRHSRWSAPDEEYEKACLDFVDALAATGLPSRLTLLSSFAEQIAPAGAVGSLVQTLLRMTVPGVPDLYQGTEFWDLSLVDPDNRRPVDFTARQATLESTAPFDELVERWHDGAIKLQLTARTLAARLAQPELFADGDYIPIEVAGGFANRFMAFARRQGGSWALVVVPRLAWGLCEARRPVLMHEALADIELLLPDSLPLEWTDALADPGTNAARTVPMTRHWPVERLLGQWPVALLLARDTLP